MIYIICIIIAIIIGIKTAKNGGIYSKDQKITVITLITVLFLIIGFFVNVVGIFFVTPTITSQKVEVRINDLTNEFIIIDPENLQITNNIDFIFSNEVETMTALRNHFVYDMGIWGFDLSETKYVILMPKAGI